MVECPTEVCATSEGGTCVASPASAVYEKECAGDGDTDAEGDEVGKDEVGEVEKGGDAENCQGRGRDGLIGEKGMDSGEVVDEVMYGELRHGRRRRDGLNGGGPMAEGEDEEDGKGEKESGKG